MKFQYSPGLLGYGAKGTDGSDGLQGTAIYFTDFDPASDVLKIRSAIENDEVLLSKSEPGTKLPGGRHYESGDVFVTSRGYIYSIDASENDYSDDKIGELSKVQFFEETFLEAQQDFVRWININDPSLNRFIIDNVQSSKDNYLIPDTVYGIELRDFTRIEYTDTSAFTLYSLAETTGDEHQALALIRTEEGFRLGNIRTNLRNTGLMFDVSSLRQKRESSNPFTSNTALGTLLTNNEINTPRIFDPNFDTDPASFIMNPNGENSTVEWDLSDFTSDTSITATLTFCKEASVGAGGYLGSHRFDSSLFQPLVFHELESAGSILITDLSIGTRYQYYITIEKDGWERRSVVKSTLQTGSPATTTITDPLSKTLTANYLGNFGSGYLYDVDLTTDSVTGWEATPAASWINVIGGSGPTGAGDFDVSLLKNSGETARTANINVTSEAPTQYISVTQSFLETSVYFNSSGVLVFDPALSNQEMNVTVKLYIKACAEGSNATPRRSRKYVGVWKNSALVKEIMAEVYGDAAHRVEETTVDWALTCDYNDVVQIRFFNQYRDGGNSWSTKTEGLDHIYGSNVFGYWHRYGGGYGQLVSVTKSNGDGKLTIHTPSRLYYVKRDTRAGTVITGVQQNAPTINT